MPVLIKDTIIRDNGGSGIAVHAGNVTAENVKSEGNAGHGLYIQAGFAAVSASFFNQNIAMGMRAEGGSKLTAHGTTISGNGSDGVFNNGSHVLLDECSIVENGSNGVENHGDLTVMPYTVVSRSHVGRNGTTVPVASGIVVNNFGGCLNCSAVYLTGSTVMRNPFYDIDATNCCLLTYQNNTVQDVLGASYSVQTPF